MLTVLQQRLNHSAARLRDDRRELNWCEFLIQVADVSKDHSHVFAPMNTLTDAARVFAGMIGHTSTVLLNSRDVHPESEVASDSDVRAPGVYVATSGSSGTAKLIHLTPDAIRRHAQAVNEHLRSDSRDTWLACLPLYHVGGLAILMRAALAGANVRITSAGNAEFVSALIDDEHITLASFVPTVLRRVVAVRQARKFPVSLRAVLVGGGPSDGALIDRVPQALRTYGMTETGSMVTCVALNSDSAERASSGKPIQGAAVRIVDEQFRDSAPGQSGRILARSEGMACGYVNDPTQTALVFREGWVVTDDQGYLDASGNLHVIGRRDRIIISGGENIALAEVEAALRHVPGVRDAICCGLDDPEWGQSIGAVLECDRQYALEELRAATESNLPSFKLPRKVICVTTLPKLPSGKPDYSAAAELLRS